MTHVDELLARYCEGDLSAADSREVARHLGECAACRAAESEVRRGVELARALSFEPLPKDVVLRIERALESAPSARRVSPWLAAAGVLATAAVLLVTLRHPAPRPVHAPPAAQPGLGGLLLEPDVGPPTRFEQAALDLHDANAGDRLSLDLRSSSVSAVKGFAEQAGLGVSLAADRPADDGDRYIPRGVARVHVGDVAALVVAYRVDGRPVTLLTARTSDVTDHTPEWSPGGKRVRFRAVGDRRLLAWTNAGQTYALVSEFPGYGQHSCLLCHTTRARREAIEALGR
jgi:anti-sigma factor RsiW